MPSQEYKMKVVNWIYETETTRLGTFHGAWIPGCHDNREIRNKKPRISKNNLEQKLRKK